MPVKATLLTLLVLTAAACGNISFEISRSESNQLTGTKWTVTSLAGSPTRHGLELTAEFTDSQINGWTGCNSYSGSYSLSQNNIRLDDLTWTEAGCPDGPEDNRMGPFNQEQLFQDLLASLETFELEESQLTLSGKAGDVVLEQKPE